MTASLANVSAPRRVLIIKPSSLGDVVTALPVLRGLRRSFPDAHLSWMLSAVCAEMLANDADLDEIVLFDRKRLGRSWRSPSAAAALAKFLASLHARRYDWVIDLQGLLRSGLFSAATRAGLRAGFADAREGASLFYTHRLTVTAAHTVDRNISLARQLGIDARPADMRLHIPEAGHAFARKFRRQHGLGGDFLICVPPTRWETKRYPPRHWRAVISALRDTGPVVLLGAPGDEDLCRRIAGDLGDGVISAAGETGVIELAALVASSAGVLCCDSAAKFIAAAVGVDSVVLMGPTRVERTGPYFLGRAIVADVPCQGCLKRRCNHISCMELIDPDEVISAVMEMLISNRH